MSAFSKISKHPIWPAAWQYFVSVYILLGLPLLAWGLDNIPSFFTHPIRIAFALIVALEALVHAWLVYITPPQPEQEPFFDLARWQAYMFETIFVVASFSDRRNILVWEDTLPLRCAGLGIYVLAESFAIWARFTWAHYLRRHPTPAIDDPVLFTGGPYQWLRHPVMLSLFFRCLGFAIAFRSWSGLVLLLALATGIYNRVHNLEKVFARRYPRQWPERSRSSWRVVPWVY